MDVVRLDSETLVELLEVLLFLILVTAARFIVSLFDSFYFSLFTLRAVDEVELVDLAGAEQGEVILATLVINAIKLCQAAVSRHDVRVSQQTPNLAQCHRERLLALCRLDLFRIKLVPVLKVGVVTQ